jgi:hypothetical protein
MKRSRNILCVPVFLLILFLPSSAQENGQSPPAPKYRLELVYILEPGPTEFIFVIGNVGFKSVASLKNYLGTLPADSTLEWAPGCVRWGGEPILESAEEMEDFRAFCVQKNIKFVLIPSG